MDLIAKEAMVVNLLLQEQSQLRWEHALAIVVDVAPSVGVEATRLGDLYGRKVYHQTF